MLTKSACGARAVAVGPHQYEAVEATGVQFEQAGSGRTTAEAGSFLFERVDAIAEEHTSGMIRANGCPAR